MEYIDKLVRKIFGLLLGQCFSWHGFQYTRWFWMNQSAALNWGILSKVLNATVSVKDIRHREYYKVNMKIFSLSRHHIGKFLLLQVLAAIVSTKVFEICVYRKQVATAGVLLQLSKCMLSICLNFQHLHLLLYCANKQQHKRNVWMFVLEGIHMKDIHKPNFWFTYLIYSVFGAYIKLPGCNRS